MKKSTIWLCLALGLVVQHHAPTQAETPDTAFVKSYGDELYTSAGPEERLWTRKPKCGGDGTPNETLSVCGDRHFSGDIKLAANYVKVPNEKLSYERQQQDIAFSHTMRRSDRSAQSATADDSYTLRYGNHGIVAAQFAR